MHCTHEGVGLKRRCDHTHGWHFAILWHQKAFARLTNKKIASEVQHSVFLLFGEHAISVQVHRCVHKTRTLCLWHMEACSKTPHKKLNRPSVHHCTQWNHRAYQKQVYHSPQGASVDDCCSRTWSAFTLHTSRSVFSVLAFVPDCFHLLNNTNCSGAPGLKRCWETTHWWLKPYCTKMHLWLMKGLNPSPASRPDYALWQRQMCSHLLDMAVSSGDAKQLF